MEQPGFTPKSNKKSNFVIIYSDDFLKHDTKGDAENEKRLIAVTTLLFADKEIEKVLTKVVLLKGSGMETAYSKRRIGNRSTHYKVLFILGNNSKTWSSFSKVFEISEGCVRQRRWKIRQRYSSWSPFLQVFLLYVKYRRVSLLAVQAWLDAVDEVTKPSGKCCFVLARFVIELITYLFTDLQVITLHLKIQEECASLEMQLSLLCML